MMTLTTPALLFPAISLLLLAYTSRFLALAALARTLHSEWKASGSIVAKRQIESLRERFFLIKWMQFLGVSSFALCTSSMILVFVGWQRWGEGAFGASLFFLLCSLFLSLREVSVSNRALRIQLEEMMDEHVSGES